MKRSTLQVIFCFTLVSFFGIGFLFSQYVHGITLDELHKSIDQKNEEIRSLEEQAKKYRVGLTVQQTLSKTLTQELSRIDKTIAQLRQDIVVTQKKIEKNQLEVSALSSEINESQTSIDKIKAGLATVVRTVSEKDDKSPLELLIQFRALSEFFQQLDYSGMLENKMLGSVATLKTLQNDLNSKKSAVVDKLSELKDLGAQLSDQKRVQEDTRKGRTEILKTTKNQEKIYQQLISEQEKKSKALEDEVQKIEQQIQITINSSLLPQKGRGILGQPLPDLSFTSCFESITTAKNCITQFFGYTAFAAGGAYNGKGHNGVDFRSVVGTQVLSSEEGVIAGTGDTDIGCKKASYGKWVLINHSNNLSTLYAHLSAVQVFKGQQVQRGSQIALAGNSGYATGPHLHFGVFATQAVTIQSIRSQVCGRMMELPISAINGYLNPLDYL